MTVCKKAYISADIEGVACISAPGETDMAKPDYGLFREQMTAEVQAACAGAFDGGVESILVKDAHWTGRNIDPRAVLVPEGRSLQLMRGWSGHPFSMVEGIDSSFDVVAFIGYHSAASRAGNPLSHTVNGRLFSRVELNGTCASEFYLFALAAATVGVPVVFISGDKTLCQEAEALIEGVTTVATIEGCGPSVRSILPSEAVRRIRERVHHAVTSTLPKPLPLPSEYVFKVEFTLPSHAYVRSFYPGVKQISDRELQLETRNYRDVLTFLKIASQMA
jgi:D-amino peptidase